MGFQKGNTINVGRKHSEEWKKQHSESLKGKHHTGETKEKIRQKIKGLKRSKETIQKMVGNRPSFIGDKNPNWRGGIMKDMDGYVYIYKPEHPFAIKMGYVAEHRLIMEKHLGRYLEPQEVVHHINGDKKDNRIENLKLFATLNQHMQYHKLAMGVI